MPVVNTTKLLKSVLHEVAIMDSELLERLVEEVGMDRVFMLLFDKPNAALKSFLRALENYEILWKTTSRRPHTVNEAKEKAQALLGSAEKVVCSVSELCIDKVVKELGLHRVLPLLLGKQCCTVNTNGANENTVQEKRGDCGDKSCSDSKGCLCCTGDGKPEQRVEREERVKEKVCIVGLSPEQLVPCVCEIRVTREGVPCEWCGGTGLLTKAVKQLVEDSYTRVKIPLCEGGTIAVQDDKAWSPALKLEDIALPADSDDWQVIDRPLVHVYQHDRDTGDSQVGRFRSWVQNLLNVEVDLCVVFNKDIPNLHTKELLSAVCLNIGLRFPQGFCVYGAVTIQEDGQICLVLEDLNKRRKVAFFVKQDSEQSGGYISVMEWCGDTVRGPRSVRLCDNHLWDDIMSRFVGKV